MSGDACKMRQRVKTVSAPYKDEFYVTPKEPYTYTTRPLMFPWLASILLLAVALQHGGLRTFLGLGRNREEGAVNVRLDLTRLDVWLEGPDGADHRDEDGLLDIWST